jgi:hypothetical protein
MSTEKDRDASDTFDLQRPLNWRYRSFEYLARCRLAQEYFPVRLTLASGRLQSAPDVRAVEAWLSATAAGSPTTAEELAQEAADRWGLSATVEGGPSDSHGLITCTAEPRRCRCGS